jgi:hypothetical protein
MNPLSFQERAIKSIKWLVLFAILLACFKPGVGSQAPGALRVFLVCTPLFIAIYRILYARMEDLFDGIGYIFTPDLLSAAFGELTEDWLKSAKVFVWVASCVFVFTGIGSYYEHAYELTRHA